MNAQLLWYEHNGTLIRRKPEVRAGYKKTWTFRKKGVSYFARTLKDAIKKLEAVTDE